MNPDNFFSAKCMLLANSYVIISKNINKITKKIIHTNFTDDKLVCPQKCSSYIYILIFLDNFVKWVPIVDSVGPKLVVGTKFADENQMEIGLYEPTKKLIYYNNWS